jgi:hypothetical protein
MTDILIPKYKDLESSPIVLPVGNLGGFFEFETFKCYDMEGKFEIPGSRRYRGRTDNIITDMGLNLIGSGMSNSLWIHVGTGNTPASTSDTGLDVFVAAQSVASTGFPTTYSARTSAPYYGSHQRYARFNANFAGGAVNVAEVTLSRQATNGLAFSRALTVDGGGSPAVIPVDDDEFLDVYYTLRNYPSHINSDGTLNDGEGTVNISGTDYDYTIRPAFITDSGYWGRNIFTSLSGSYQTSGGSSDSYKVYGPDAALGSISSEPTATLTDTTLVGFSTTGTYATDTFYNDISYHWGLSEGNLTGGIKAMRLGSTLGVYQLLFDTPIPKTVSNTLTFPQRTAWARKAL